MAETLKRSRAIRRRARLHQVVEECLLLAVDVAEEGEIQRRSCGPATRRCAGLPTVLLSRITKRAKCSVSNCANGTSGLFGLTDPGASFMESSKPRSSASRDGNDRHQNHEISLRRHGLLVEYLITRWLVMRHLVHVMPQLRQLVIHPLPGTALITQRTMLGDSMPGVIGELPGEFHLTANRTSVFGSRERCH